MTNAIVATVGPLVGVILGFVLNEITSWRRRAASENRQKKTALRLASLEIEHNLIELKDYWTNVWQLDPKREEQYQQDPTIRQLDLARRLINLPLPMWKHSIWGNYMGVLSTVLGEARVVKVYRFHARLDSLTTIRNRLAGLSDEQKVDHDQANRSTDGFGLWFTPSVFNTNAPSLWAQFAEIAAELLEAWNPI